MFEKEKEKGFEVCYINWIFCYKDIYMSFYINFLYWMLIYYDVLMIENLLLFEIYVYLIFCVGCDE